MQVLKKPLKKSLLYFIIYKTMNYILSLINFILYQNNRKTSEFYYYQPKKIGIKPGLPLAFIDSVRFSINSLKNSVENLGETDFYHVSKEFNINILDLVKRMDYLLWLLNVLYHILSC